MQPVMVLPGEVFVTDNRHLSIETILGSCVAVCAFDPEAGICGMNHIMYATDCHRNIQGLHYSAVEAVDSLVAKMIHAGATPGRICCKIFGGAGGIGIYPNGETVGQANVRITMERLDLHDISIIASDLGGTHGCVIVFDVETYQVGGHRIHSANGH